MALSVSEAIGKKLTQGIYSGSCRWNIGLFYIYTIIIIYVKKTI